MWLLADVDVVAAVSTAASASGAGTRSVAAISCAAAFADAVAIFMMSSTLSCGVPMLSFSGVGASTNWSISGCCGKAGGNSKAPGLAAAGLGDLERIKSPLPRPWFGISRWFRRSSRAAARSSLEVGSGRFSPDDMREGGCG